MYDSRKSGRGSRVPVEMRVLSWNLHGLRDDTVALAEVVRRLDPDVMCVQEAPKYLRWRAKTASLARDCGLFYVTGVAARVEAMEGGEDAPAAAKVIATAGLTLWIGVICFGRLLPYLGDAF